MVYGCLSIFKEFSDIVKNYPTKPAVFFKKDKQFHSINYSELYNQAIKLGNLLYSKGLRQQDKVAILLGNQLEWPIAFMAIQYIGAVAVPIDINLTFKEIRRLIFHSGAKILICSKKTYVSLSVHIKDIKDLEVLLVDSPEFLEKFKLSSAEILMQKNDATPNDKMAAMFYTSGTTDFPKAVMLSARNLLSNVQAIKKLDITDSKDVFISLLPLHHTYSFMVTCLLPLLEGAQVSYPASFSPEEILTCIKETRVNILVGVPQLFSLFHCRIKSRIGEIPLIARFFIAILRETFWLVRKIFKVNLNKHFFWKLHRTIGPSIEFMISGGAHLDEAIAKDFFKWGFTILEGYGLTETSPIATFNTPRNYRIGSVGKALPDVEIKIINPDKDGIGEVAIKGPNVMLGYYQMPQETKMVFNNEGWFLSGDLGYLDKKGYLYIKGRKDEMIVLSSGKKVNPEEIERHYSLSPFIKEICVFTSQKTGLLEGAKQLMAVVVPNEAYFRQRGQVNIEEKIKWELDSLSYRLSSYKRIKGFVISKENLPRTTLGKIIRYGIGDKSRESTTTTRKKEEELSEEDLILFSSDACKKTLKYLSNRFKREVNLNDHLELNLGLDSLGRTELLLELEQFLKIQIPESEAMEIFYVNTIKELILKAKDFLPKEIIESKETEFAWASLLRQTPPPRMLNIIRLKPLFIDKVTTPLVIGFLKILFGVFFLLRVKGKDNFPKKGPYIIYANHTSYLDGLIIAASIPFRLAPITYYVGFREVFLHPLLRNMTKVARLVPIDAAVDLVEALQTCSYLLKNSKLICYFPEGGRAPHGEVIKFKKGIGILTKELNVPLVPVYINGSFRILSRQVKFLKPTRLNVTVGKTVNALDVAKKDDSYEAIAENLRKELIKLTSTCPTR